MEKVVITGGSSGLGYEVVKGLLERGVSVVNLSRHKCDLDVENILVDLSKQNQIEKSIETVLKKHSDADTLILNSGMMYRHPVGECPPKEVEYQFEVNVMGHIKLAEGLVSVIRKNKGDIVLIGSTSSFSTNPETAVYTAAKHAVLGYIKSLQAELKKEDVRVIGFHPGGFQSEFHKKAKSDLKKSELMPAKGLAKLLLATLDLPRSMQVSEVIVDRKKAAMR